MAEDFRTLRIWQISSELVEEIYQLTQNFPKEETYSLTSQIRRSANSVAANIAESSGRYHKKDKIKVLYIARGEIEETRSHLLIVTKLGYSGPEVIHRLENQYNLLKQQVNGYIRFLRESQFTS